MKKHFITTLCLASSLLASNQITQLTNHNFKITMNGYATISSKNNIDIISSIKGRLTNFHLLDGQNVHKGDKLFVIKPVVLKSEIEQAKIEVKIAKENYDFLANKHKIVNNLYKSKSISMEELQSINMQFIKAKYQLELKQQLLKKITTKYSITTPDSGIVLDIVKQNGNIVSQGEHISTIGSCKDMLGEAQIFDQKNLLKIGDKIILDNDKNDIAKVDAISKKLANSGAKKIFFNYKQNSCDLLPNSIHNISIVSDNINAMVVPTKAIIEDDGKMYLLIQTGNKTKKINVKIGIEQDGYTQILSQNINKNDNIIVEGAYELYHKDIKQKIIILD